MNVYIIIFSVTLVLFLYEIRNYLSLRNSVFLYEEYGVRFYRHKERHDKNNAAAIVSLFKKDAIVLYDNHVDASVLYHELAHLQQKRKIVVFLLALGVAIGILLNINQFLVVLTIPLGKAFFMYLERDADLQVYLIYNIMYNTQMERPSSRIERFIEWVLNSHAPDWVRTRKEYYDKKTKLIYLFFNDLLV